MPLWTTRAAPVRRSRPPVVRNATKMRDVTNGFASGRVMPREEGAPLLEIHELTVRFGGVTALDGPSLNVTGGQICGLIGPNGAGKTTLFNCVSRLYEPESGRIVFEGEDVLARAPHEVSELGIARTFQNLGLFPSMTVRENVLLGAYQPRPARLPRERPRLARERPRRGTAPGGGGGGARAPRPAGGGRARRGGPAVRNAQAGRAGTRALPAPTAPDARRAGERAGARGGGGAGRSDPLAARRARPDRASRRAQHGDGDGALRAGGRARPGTQDRRRAAGRGPGATPPWSRPTWARRHEPARG